MIYPALDWFGLGELRAIICGFDGADGVDSHEIWSERTIRGWAQMTSSLFDEIYLEGGRINDKNVNEWTVVGGQLDKFCLVRRKCLRGVQRRVLSRVSDAFCVIHHVNIGEIGYIWNVDLEIQSGISVRWPYTCRVWDIVMLSDSLE